MNESEQQDDVNDAENNGLTRLQTLRISKNERKRKYNEMNEIDPEGIAADILTLQLK